MNQESEMLPFRVGCFRGGGEAGGKTVETRRSYLTSAAVGNPGGVHVLVKYMSSPCTYTHTYTHTDTHTHTHTNTHTHTPGLAPVRPHDISHRDDGVLTS